MATEAAKIQLGKSVCRYCFTEGCSKDVSSVYIWKERKEVYSEMLSETFNISIVCADSNLSATSHHICELCIGRLRDASEFKKQVIECEQTLQWQILQPAQSLSTLRLSGVAAEKEMDLNVKKETVSLGDDAYDMRTASKDYSHYNTHESKIPKEELFSDSLNTIQLLKRSTCISTKTKGFEDQKRNNKKTKSKQSTKKLDRNTAARNVTKRKNIGNTADDAVRKNSIAILRHSTAYPFQPSKTSFRCCFCPYTPSHYDPNDFRQHMDSTHAQIDKSSCLKHHNESMRRVDVTNLRCKDCSSNQFQSLEDLAKHLVEVHRCDMDLSQSIGLVPIRLETERFACVICSKSYSTLHQLSRHSGTHFYRNICYRCGGNFETLKGLNKHVLLKHSKDKFICQTCKLPFPDLSSKKEHLRNSKKCQSFKCKFCKERFLCIETQQAHSVKAHGEAKTTYTCPECGDIFEKRINRYKHFKMVHTDDFKCSHCGTKFSNNRALQDHIARIHTFERKYKCPTCDKAFIDARTLRTHTFIHDESKKHACPVCTRSFTMKIRLKHHVQKYHPDILTDIFPMQSNAVKISS